jgi:hypothetical protein
MNDREKKKIRDITECQLPKLGFGLGMYIRNELGLHEGNDALIKACARSEHGDFESYYFLNNIDTASDVIIEAIWNKLNMTT